MDIVYVGFLNGEAKLFYICFSCDSSSNVDIEKRLACDGEADEIDYDSGQERSLYGENCDCCGKVIGEPSV